MRDDIIKFARYGYLNLSADAKTTVYIDNKMVGDAPLTRWPLEPGIHKVKVIGPRGKTKKFEVTIYGGQDIDAPPIQWKEK
jgi:hypothetical protein